MFFLLNIMSKLLKNDLHINESVFYGIDFTLY